MLPATIEELILEDIDSSDMLPDNIVAPVPDSKVNAPSNNSKCLAYLQSIDLLYLTTHCSNSRLSSSAPISNDCTSDWMSPSPAICRHGFLPVYQNSN
ncbi:hypothetical protein BDN71DRAFT_1452350 [Pleurotus eryngii]|uniref:Uncharacterized protein n=1 Tax=Pleurotus eryngii TaxID=5323 RepID=A0A9P6DDV6_PLEER|nr:hypothetical protein BDN71DRAFT_1452350 [Pleurotus eryngii]